MALIQVTNRNAHELHDEVWNELMKADSEILESLMPKAFVPDHATLAQVRWPTPTQMGLALSRTVDFVRVNAKGEEFPTSPPASLTRSILEQWKEEKQALVPSIIRDFYVKESK